MRLASSRAVPVLIVGAGPTGLVLANLLARRGIACLVAEREPAIHPLPRAVHFDDEVLRILQEAGLEREARAISRPIPGMQVLDARHRVLTEFQRDPEGGPYGHPESNFFDQPDLEAVLRRGLERYPHAELRGGTEVEAIEPRPPGAPAPVRVTLRDRATGALSELHAQVVVACDGARSRSRALVGAEIQDLRFEESWLVVDVRTPVPLARWDGCQQLADPARPATYVPVGRGRYRWEFMLMPGDTPAEMLREERVRELLAPWLEGGEREKVEVFRRAVYTFRARVARGWRRGRVLLAGDAAHQTPPFLGQGLCAGVRDAANLAWKLDLLLRGHASDAVLDSYEAERRPHVRRVIAMAVTLGRVMMAGGPGARAVDRVLHTLTRLPFVAGRAARITFPSFPRGPLVLPRGRRDAAGHALPQPEVRTADGVARRLDELLGPGFALVAAESDPAAGFAALPPEDHALWQALGLRLVRLDRGSVLPGAATPAGMEVTHAVDTQGALARWLRRHRATCALVRPDRVVAAAAKGEPPFAAWARALRAAGLS